MEMARDIKVAADMNGVMPTAMGPSSLASRIVVAPVTAVTIVHTANVYPSRL